MEGDEGDRRVRSLERLRLCECVRERLYVSVRRIGSWRLGGRDGEWEDTEPLLEVRRRLAAGWESSKSMVKASTGTIPPNDNVACGIEVA